MSRATPNVLDRPYFDSPETPCPMGDHHFRDAPTELTRQNRQVPVHSRAKPQRLDDLGPEHLQGAAVIVDPKTSHHAEQPVRNHGWHVTGENIVFPILAPPAHDVMRSSQLQ